MLFRPTRRTQILMAGVVVAGLVGAYVMWRNSQEAQQLRAQRQAGTVAAQPISANARRAEAQLAQRLGEHQLVYFEENGPAVCGYVGPRGAAARGPLRVQAFVSLPGRLALSSDGAGFDDLLARSCPSLPGARRPEAPAPAPSAP